MTKKSKYVKKKRKCAHNRHVSRLVILPFFLLLFPDYFEALEDFFRLNYCRSDSIWFVSFTLFLQAVYYAESFFLNS